MEPLITACGIDVYAADIPSGGDTPRRQREQSAVLALARAVFGLDTVISHSDDGAPYIAGSDATISVSHSRRTAILAVAPAGRRIGVDIEEAREQLRRVAPRVFSDAEISACGDSLPALALAWTLKEAAYKCAGVRGLDFRRDIIITPGADTLLAAGHPLAIAFSAPLTGQYLSLLLQKSSLQ